MQEESWLGPIRRKIIKTHLHRVSGDLSCEKGKDPEQEEEEATYTGPRGDMTV